MKMSEDTVWDCYEQCSGDTNQVTVSARTIFYKRPGAINLKQYKKGRERKFRLLYG